MQSAMVAAAIATMEYANQKSITKMKLENVHSIAMIMEPVTIPASVFAIKVEMTTNFLSIQILNKIIIY